MIDTAEHRLLRAAHPVLDDVARHLTDTDSAILLVDSDSRMVSRVLPGVQIERDLEGAGAVIGSEFAEDVMGTTALGTPLETRRGMTINGEEHFLDQFKRLSCYGRPILHPVSRRLEGIICMTNIGTTVNPMFVPFLDRVAGDIEQRLLDGSRVSQRILVDAFGRIAPRRDMAVAAIGDDLVLTNSLAAELLGSADIGMLRALTADLAGDEAELELTLASEMPVGVRVRRVAGGGALYEIRPGIPAPPIPRRPAFAPKPVGLPGQWTRVAITGEPGTGRSTAATELVDGHTCHRIEATDLIVGGGPDLTDALREPREVLVVENVQLLDARHLTLLRRALTDPHGARIILTAAPFDDLPRAAAALLALCPQRIELAPLRRRTAEIGSLASGLLGTLHPGMRLSASAIEALAAADWPGNLTELVMALDTAANAASGRSIAVGDLPAHYRAATAATLTGRMRAEREAIVDAMRDCGNNKAHAAKRLGISRSTLYTKLRTLKIDHL